MTPLFSAVIAVLGAVIVAVLGHFFAVHRKKTDDLAALRFTAYTDFISAAARLASTRRLGYTQDQLEELSLLNDAKIRVCMCASAEVIHRLEDFWLAGGTLEIESEILAFTRLILEMRKSLGSKQGNLSNINISRILFKLEPAKYSFRTQQAELAAYSGKDA